MYIYERNNMNGNLTSSTSNFKASISSNISANSYNSSDSSKSSSSYSVTPSKIVNETNNYQPRYLRNNEKNNPVPYSYSFSSSSSSPKSLKNDSLFIEENSIGSTSSNSSTSRQNSLLNEQQKNKNYLKTLPCSRLEIKERKSLNDIVPSENNYRNYICNYQQNELVQPVVNKTTSAKILASIKERNEHNRQEQNQFQYRMSNATSGIQKELINNCGINEISNKLFYNKNNNSTSKLKVTQHASRTNFNTPVHKKNSSTIRTNEICNESFSRSNRFYSLRRILSKKLSNTDLANCAKPKPMDSIYDNKMTFIKPNCHLKQQETASNATSNKILNIIKIYKNVLNRLQKTFHLNEVNESSTTEQLRPQSKIRPRAYQHEQQLVDKSTQTQHFSNEKSSPLSHQSTKSLYSSLSSSASATLSNYQISNKSSKQFEKSEDDLFDLKCDLEVASIFDRNLQPLHLNYKKNYCNNQNYVNNEQFNSQACVNNYVNLNKGNYYHYYYNNYLNKEYLNDYGTLC